MAFDGITIANIVKDLQDNLIDGRLSKTKERIALCWYGMPV